jgi:hypothetical protein
MEVTNISVLNPTQFINQDYTSQDESLLNSLNVNKEFGLPEDKVEVHVISPNGDLIDSVYDFRNYTTRQTYEDTSLYNQIELNPKSDLESFGLNQGQYDIIYNFYRQLFLSSEANKFYITEISSDRTEIKISTNNTSYNDLGQSYLKFVTERNSRAFYSDFILNFGNNKTYIGVNVALDNVNTTLPSLYIKLYEPLPSNFKLKDTFWIVESISEPFSFQVNTEFIAEAISDTTPLRGPNVSIELAEKNNLTTPYLNLSTLLDPSTSSTYQQLQSWIEEKSIEITVDYNELSNFVHFSSAQERLENFKYKLTQIQSLQSDINSLNNLNALTSQGYITVSKDSLQSRIDTLIAKFDGYEYFLYFESGSNCWPKSNSTKPYTNYNVTSPSSSNWFEAQSNTAYNYDVENRDYIWNSLPEYIREDTQNSNLELFVAMLGQHYDYIWTYVRDITDLQVADNRVDFGISKDLVADTLRNFGIKLYTNSRGQEDLYLSLLGIDENYGTLPSTGSYVIENYVTASQYTIPDNDIVKETYKRIYHNLPYLLKTKGTRRGLRALINCFGIPETILKVKEFGGNKKDQNIIEQFNEKFNYSLNLNSTASLAIPFQPSYKQFLSSSFNDIYPDTFEYRFKFTGTLPTQSILETSDNKLNIRVINISNSYANLDFRISGSNGWTNSTPITLPLYNSGWWNLNLTRQTGSLRASATSSNNTYTLTIGNKDDKGIQYLNSSSLTVSSSYNSVFNTIKTLYPGGNNINYPFSGSIQEFRYWIGSISSSNFTDHVLNPQSISNSGVTGSYDKLIFRLPLGSELDNTIKSPLSSVHPSPTASFWNGVTTSSTASLNNSSSATYIANHELFLVNTPNVGTITEIDEKVRIANPNLIPGDVLTPYISIQKPEEYPYTPDLSIVEVAISPQDSINEDIISQLGSFNIDEYIGDPRLDSSNTYPALNELRDFYFKKYSNSQNLFDIIKLLSYFDNSLFKMIKDFVPARTNLSTGLVIKSHILERNKLARHEPTLTFVNYSGSIETAFMSGSNGLNLDLNTDNTITTQYISGSISKLNTDRRELITGELGGTVITAYTQSPDNIVYELNYIAASSSQALHDRFYRLPLNPTLNNISQARTTPKYLDIDYAYNPITPVNFNFLTASLESNLSNPAFPFLNAAVQDSNYTLKRHTQPRYEGSKLIGTKYNTYTAGDISYGSDPVINAHPVKFAYFKEITSQSLTLPGRTNVNLKYLIDSASNVIELTEANKNIFDVQNIFNRTNANIALDNINQPSKQKSLNGLKGIYAGGFRYEPILQNYSTAVSTHNSLNFTYLNDIEIPNPATGSLVTQSIESGITVGQPYLTTDLSYSQPNILTNFLTTTLISGITFPVIRNTTYAGKLVQRVTGSLKVTIKISPPVDQKIQLWDRANIGPYSTDIPISNWEDLRNLTYTFNGQPSSPYLFDNLRYALVPIGHTLYTDNSGKGNVTGTVVGSGTKVEIPSFGGNRGIDNIKVLTNDTSASFTTSGISNNLISSNNLLNLISLSPNPGIYGVPGIDGLIIEATYPFEGEIILEAGVGNSTTATPIQLKNLNGIIGKLTTSFTFAKVSTSPQLQFTTRPTYDVNPLYIGRPYYMTEAPSKIYLTGTSDRGFNSGSSNNNWYFERGNKVESGSVFTLMTASVDLSRLYYDHYVPGNSYYGNSIIQTLPTESINAGYQQITEYFNPKKGDLIRFYNHDNGRFPFSSIFEREIINIYPPQGQIIGTGSNGSGSYENRLVFEVSEDLGSAEDNIPNQACTTSGSYAHIMNFIMLSKVPDETNIVISSDKRDGQTSAGIVLPENISTTLKNEAGNIVKDLKSKNLI